jgi:alpha-L-rhamnosidase
MLPLRRLPGAALLALLPSGARAQPLRVEALRTEYAANPVGIDERSPRLSWELRSTRRGTMQSAYEVRVARDQAALGGVPLWDSGRIASEGSTFRAYGGPPLESGRRYAWQVRVWDDAGRASAWSAPAYWEMGLLRPEDWRARWITPDLAEDTTRSNPSPMLRRAFSLDGRIASARLYVTSLGLHEVEIDGRRVGDRLFTPGWTSYHNRLQYETYDVTDLVAPGPNAIGATLGDGWYRGHIGFAGKRNVYGSRLALLAQLVVRYADGRVQTVGTDTAWRASTGPIVASDIYDGETYDARLAKPGWSRAGYDDRAWSGVRPLEPVPNATLVAPQGPPVRRAESLTPVKVFRTPDGRTVYDMGQNMVGWVRLRVHGPRGTTVTLHHAEVLDRDGNLYTENLRAAKATARYTLAGDGEETFEPHFTFFGFRYVSVEGLPEPPAPDAVTGVVIHSDMPRTGTFATSNALVNQLQHNIEWGQRGNFLDVPTDCPQRDERLGWTGDAQVFSRTAAFNRDVNGFFAKWLGDVAADQAPNGVVPHVIPDVLSAKGDVQGGSSGWADVAVVVPWNLYQSYGDARLLERQYPSMRKWVDYERAQAGDSLLWRTGWHFGDWLSFATTRADYPGATTDKDFLATAYFAHSTDLLARSADALGKAEDARRYRALFDSVRAAFAREFVTPSGRLTPNTQTAYALALGFGLLADSLRPIAARRLAADVRAMGHLTTGFLGTPELTRALSDHGHLDAAYALLLNTRYPSWLYPVTQGATTIWERWDGRRPDSTFQDPGMNSFNHYAYGAVGDWMYRVVAGLDMDPSAPGYRHALLHPQPGGGLSSARASLHTPYGELASSWTLAGDDFTLDARVPPNARATVRLPGASLAAVTESSRALAAAPGVGHAAQDGDDVVVEIGSGDYRFAYKSPALADRVRRAAPTSASR